MILNNYKRLIQDKYLTFFEQKDATYMYEDGIHQARYFGVAFEFVCEISSSDLHVDYNNLYDNVFKDEKWLYKQLKVKGYSDFCNILLATVDINEKIVIYERNYNETSNNVLE